MDKLFYTNVSRRGDDILLRGINNGESFSRRVKFNPTLFVPSNKETKYKTLDGTSVSPVHPGTMRECREFIQKYTGIQGFDVYGNTDYIYQFIGKIHPGEVEYDFNQLKIAYIDIETTCELGFPNVDDPQEEINAITMIVGKNQYVLGLGEFDDIDGAECHWFFREEDLIDKFLDIWEHECPDIVSGWNVRFFDIPYLYSRISSVRGTSQAKRMSPWRMVQEKTINRMNREQTAYDLVGISTLDYYELYLTFTYTNQESYRLDHIANIELGESKLSYDEFENMAEFYKKDFDKFVRYNHKDTELIVRLEEKMKLMELAVALAYSAKVNFVDVYSQVRTWDQIIYHYLSEQNIVIPMKSGSKKDEQYAGAYVKDPIVGRHEWVVSFDLNSLYPHLIMQYNISPETKIQEEKDRSITPDSILRGTIPTETKHSLAANGTCYTKDRQGFLPALMEKMYKERKMYKKMMIEAEKRKQESPSDRSIDFEISKYHNFQQVRKIQLNSAYGAIGNEWFRYFDVDMAEAITLSGQLSIRWIINYLNEFLNETLETTDIDYVVASDTDSVYLTLDGLVRKFLPDETDKNKIVDYLDKASEETLQPFIDEKYQELAELMNAYQNKMVMGREVIADCGIWTAKKRYMLNVWDSEGVRYKSPKLKIMGIETTRSSTPQVVRDWLKKSISIILTGTETEMIRFIDEKRREFNGLDVEDIAFPRGVSNLDKYRDHSGIYRKSTPIAVKGALIYNHFVKENGLDRKYNLISDGEKVKFVMLKRQNPIAGPKGDQVISFPNRLPVELGLQKYVDYEKQFEKSFLDPLTSILDIVRWRTEQVSTLEGLFS
tara:strand:- start:5764 stop:8262 length:2499 start_codon:yes stop_codon:yes gene_type:complete